jgi:Solute carrier family 35
MLVWSDVLTNKNFTAKARGKGDAFMIVGATLYGFSGLLFLRCMVCSTQVSIAANATEEYFVRRSPLYEVLARFLPTDQRVYYLSSTFFEGPRAVGNVGSADQWHTSCPFRTCRHVRRFLEQGNWWAISPTTINHFTQTVTCVVGLLAAYTAGRFHYWISTRLAH